MNITFNDYIGLFEEAASKDYCERMINAFEKLQNSNPSAVTNNAIAYGGELKRKDTAIFFEQHEPELCSETNK